MNKSLFGLNENIVAAISYFFLFVGGIFVYILERENKFVRFHALQSTVVFLLIAVLSWVIGIFHFIPIIGGLVICIFNFCTFVIWAYLVFAAYKGQMFRVPIIGDIVYAQVNK